MYTANFERFGQDIQQIDTQLPPIIQPVLVRKVFVSIPRMVLRKYRNLQAFDASDSAIYSSKYAGNYVTILHYRCLHCPANLLAYFETASVHRARISIFAVF